ncbi:MAG: putative DNA binding domain-containing protein [Acidobacteria bacterium]|nr:putative DNA binding domain-containing protein [Acidobacteriota bacterium]
MEEKMLIDKLNELRSLPSENEVFEFKEAKNTFDSRKLGEYFSALSNEANLKGADCAWLIFGVEDKKKTIVGSNYRNHRKDLHNLKKEIADHTTNRITFIEIYELKLPEGRVVMFRIPPAPRGIPVAFQGHYFARDNESLVALNIHKIERIRKEDIEEDWSAEICPEATLEDLDPSAIFTARRNYKNKFPAKTAEVDSWDDITFLNKAKLTIKGKITRTAIILLGRDESEHFVSPADIKIRWILKDSKGIEKDYLIESCPFILAVDRIYAKIRNLRYRYIKVGTLFPDEVDRYEPFVIREAINNCIAHQDYTLGGRINVIEEEDQLIFTNVGAFIPGSVENVIKDDAPEEKYRNRFLAAAMVNLNMVETIGSGIRRMFNYQRVRFFPLPEYDLSNNRVKVTVIGKVLDMDYASVLARDESLTLEEIMMLDKVQKRKALSSEEAKHLRRKKLIEGIRPNYIISAAVAQKTGQKAEYSKFRAFDKQYYLDLITKAIKEHKYLDRKDVDELLWDKLPEWMDEKKKKIKINHLLTELSGNKIIKNSGTRSNSKWILFND